MRQNDIMNIMLSISSTFNLSVLCLYVYIRQSFFVTCFYLGTILEISDDND